MSNIYGCSNSATISNLRQGIYVETAQRLTFCIPLLGSLGIGADKMIPIGQLYDDILIEISWEANSQAVALSGIPTATYSVLDCQLELQVVELSDEGMKMVEDVTPFDRPVYMHANSWRHYSSTLPSGTSGIYSTLVPARFASLKGLVCCPRRSVEIVDPVAYSISSRVNSCIQNYWWRFGSAVVPQRAVQLWNASNTGGCAEGFSEIQKFFHGWNRPDMASGVPFTQYNVTDLGTADTTIGGNSTTGVAAIAATTLGVNSHTNAFAIAQELETFANRDGLLLSGLNTLASQVFFEMATG